MDPHALALLVMVVGSGLGTMLLADAAEDALRRAPEIRRRALLRRRLGRPSLWDDPRMLQGASVTLLAIMALCGACLVFTSP